MWWQGTEATNYLIIFILLWLSLLSFYLFKAVSHYKKIIKGTKGQNLAQILENIINRQNSQGKNMSQLAQDIVKIQEKQKSNFQKSAVIRFNPFEDTGGDQSFAVAFLDGKNNGIVISSLHSRGNTRIYAKAVSKGMPATHQFSKEEKEVVEKACLVGRHTARQP